METEKDSQQSDSQSSTDSSQGDSGDSQNTLPDTQPIHDVDEDEAFVEPDQSNSGRAWGCLLARSDNYFDTQLKTDTFKVGREPSLVDYPLQAPKIPEDSLDQFSRVHFEIIKNEENDVYLIDRSLNGTFVNGERIGKGNRRPLIHKDLISLRNQELSAFQFIRIIDDDEENNSALTLTSSSDELDQTTTGGSAIPDEVRDKYIIGPQLGKGSGGVVYLGYDRRHSYTKVALKIIRSAGVSPIQARQEFDAEVVALKRLKHPCIIGLKEVIETCGRMVIVLELATGGELFDYVLADYNSKKFDERVAKLQFYQISSAIAYLHSKQICHRDLKLENILLARKGKTSLIKITDFGLSKYLDQSMFMTTFVGTMTYVAPEVLNNIDSEENAYTTKADCWSLGCILYSLLCGSPAFWGSTEAQIRQKISRGRIQLPDRQWSNVSAEAKDLVTQLLNLDPQQRLSAAQILRHKWFTLDPFVVRKAKQLMDGKVDSVNLDEAEMHMVTEQVDEIDLNANKQVRRLKRHRDAGDEIAGKKMRTDPDWVADWDSD